MKTDVPFSIRQLAVAGLTFFFGLSNPVAVAQAQSHAVRLVRYEVKQSEMEPFKNALRNLVLQALSQPGNIMAEAHFEQDRPNVLWLIERWENPKAQRRFYKKPVAVTLQSLEEKSLLGAVRVIEMDDLMPLSKKQWRASANKEEDPLVIMLFVDAQPGTEQEFRNRYEVAMPEFRSETGVVTYQLSVLRHDVTQFVTYEKFRDEAAFQYHLNFPPIMPVLDFLNHHIENPPFQDSVHRLIEFAPMNKDQY